MPMHHLNAITKVAQSPSEIELRPTQDLLFAFSRRRNPLESCLLGLACIALHCRTSKVALLGHHHFIGQLWPMMYRKAWVYTKTAPGQREGKYHTSRWGERERERGRMDLIS